MEQFDSTLSSVIDSTIGLRYRSFGYQYSEIIRSLMSRVFKIQKIKVGREATAPLKGRAFKIEISKVSGSALVAEICTDPHNRLLRRQHCSSLCLQSEGHEHVANMASALGHDFVGFSVLVRHNIRPPHFASKVSYSASPQTSAKCSRDTPCSVAPCSDAALACYLLKNEPKFSWILNTLSYRA